MKRKYDLDERLIEFAAVIIGLAEKLPQSLAGRHIAGQIIRSGTAPALHYGEAQGGESRKDFIHKMKTALKELRETYNALRIVQKTNWVTTEYLLSIFVKSIETAAKNQEKEYRPGKR